jgi:hypothetical protein
MGPIRIHTTVPKDHRVEISLPPEVPEGPADLAIIVTPTAPADGEDWRADRREMLARLAEFRERFKGRNLNMAEEVIKLRREDD